MNGLNCILLFQTRRLSINQVRLYLTKCILNSNNNSFQNTNKYILNERIKDIKYHSLRSFCVSKYLCDSTEKNDILLDKHRERVRKEFQIYIEQNKERLRDTEQKLKDKKDVLLKDIKETKDKVKGKVEEIIEVRLN